MLRFMRFEQTWKLGQTARRLLLLAALGSPLAAQAVDLVVNNVDTPDPVPAGGIVTYQIRVTNDSFTQGATGVQSSHSVSAGATYLGFTGAGVNCTGMTVGSAGPGTVTCSLPDLAANGGEVQFQIQLRSASVGMISLGATASATQADTDLANNVQDQGTTVIAGANLAMQVTPANMTAASGSTVSLNLQVNNLGPDTASHLVVSMPVPTGLSIESVPAGCTNSGGTIRCTVAGPINAGASAALGAITGQVIAAANSSIVGSSTVQVSNSAPPGTAQDPDASNDTALASIEVTAGSDLRIEKSRSPAGDLLVGDALNFVLTPTYSGDVPGTVTVTDVIPANYTIGTLSSSQNGWTCGVSGQTVTCTKTATGAAGLNQALGAITIPVTATAAGSGIVNEATIAGTLPDPTPANNTGNDGGVNIVPPTVDLEVTKTGPSPALVVVGVPFEYRIRARNAGTADYYGTMTLTDSLPEGITVNSYTLNGWSCDLPAPVTGPATIACTLTYTSGAPLAAEANTPFLVMNVTATESGTINNSVLITADCNLGAGNCGDGDTWNYSIQSSIGTDSADVRVLKSVIGPDPVPAGDVLAYRIEVVNDGPAVSGNVVLRDTLTNLINNSTGATGAGYVGHVVTPGAATGASCSTAESGSTGRALTCNFTSIPVCTPGSDCPVVVVEVRPGGNGGSRGNTAQVVSNGTADPQHSNNSVTVSSTIEPRADVTVAKNATPGNIRAGQPLTYVVTATNVANGLSAAANVTVQDTLPLDVTFLSASPSSGSCSTVPAANSTTTVANRTVTCNLGTLNNGSQGTVTITVRPNTATRGTTIVNDVSVTTSTTETNTGNNTAQATATVDPPVLDLVINKSDSVDPVASGDDTVYLLTVTNAGPSAAENVVVDDVLPATGQLSFQSVTTTAGSCPVQPAPNALGGTVSCTIGYMPPGTVQTVSITMRGMTKGVYNNVASVTSNETALGFDTSMANNTDGDTTTVRTKVDLQVVSKTPSSATVNLRETFDFVIRVRNNGPDDEADDVQLNDTLPANMVLTGAPVATVVSGSATLTTCTGSAGSTAFSCSLGTLSNGGVVDITVPVRVTAVSSAPQVFTNTASATTTSLDTNPGNNSSSGNVTVNSSSLAGRVFVDHNDDGAFSGDDSGLPGVTITLTGTTFDGQSVTRTVDTDPSGQYIFTGLPHGTYQIDEGPVTGTQYADGRDTAGTAGGDATSVNDRISAITLPPNTAATGYNFAEVPVPLIGIAKSAGAVINNGDGTYDVEFTLNVANAGPTALSAVQVNDTLDAEFGNYTAGAPAAGQYTIISGPTITAQTNGAALTAVPAGAFTGSGAGTALLVPASSSLPNFGTGTASTAQIRFRMRFFPVTPGPFNNTATTQGTSPANTTATDDSVDGSNPDANGNEDPTDDQSPTIVSLDGQAIGLAKAVSTVVQTGPRRFRVPYSLIVRNLSASVTATNVQIVDDLSATFPTAQSITIASPATVSACTATALATASPAFNGLSQQRLLAGDQNLQPGEQCTIGFAVEVDFGSNPLPSAIQNNQAIVTTAQSPGGTVIATDLSDNGVDPDPNGNGNANESDENDPTPVSFAAAGMSAVTGKVYFDRNHDRVDNDGTPPNLVAGFRVRVFNGEGNLVGESVSAADGSYTVNGLYPSTPGNPATYYRIQFVEPHSGAVYGNSQSDDPVPARNGVITNGEIAELQLEPGITTVNQNLPLDPSGVVYDAVTRNPVSGAAVTLTHLGTPVPGHCLVGGMSTQMTGPNGMYQFLLLNPAPPGCPGVAGDAQTYTLEVVQPAGYLPPASAMIPPTAASFTPGNGGVAAIQAQAEAPTGNQPTTYYFSFVLTVSGVPATSSSDVVNNHIPLDPILGGAITMTKMTPLVNVARGELVPYTITASNTLAATLANIDLADTIPAGFRYRVGSATLNGVPVEPQVSGRVLRWPNQSFAPNERKTLRMILVVGSGVSEGEYVNRVVAINNVVDRTVSNTATAAVRVVPDPTFDCSDIIGKVFDDRNANGYQDQGEPGIANVRVVTPRGLLVTTDHEGRFHVPCAEIPNQDRGSNFVMKLDERTLPTGYRLTTENPRDVRVTRGKLVKLNFGATVHRVVRLELADAAFEPGSPDLKQAWLQRLADVENQLAARPSVLRIAYRRGAESADLAQQRVDAIRRQIEDMWHTRRTSDAQGTEQPVHPLLIETEVEGE